MSRYPKVKPSQLEVLKDGKYGTCSVEHDHPSSSCQHGQNTAEMPSLPDSQDRGSLKIVWFLCESLHKFQCLPDFLYWLLPLNCTHLIKTSLILKPILPESILKWLASLILHLDCSNCPFWWSWNGGHWLQSLEYRAVDFGYFCARVPLLIFGRDPGTRNLFLQIRVVLD